MIPGLRVSRSRSRLAFHHIATISIGMAAVTAAVSLMLAVAFRPLPFRNASQLVGVWNQVQSGAAQESLSGKELTEIHGQTNDLFVAVGGVTPLRMWLLDVERGSEPVRILRLEESAFRALDIRPVIGQSVSGTAGSASAGIGRLWISHDVWQRRFGGSPAVVGQSIRLALNEAGQYEAPSEIVGVLPRSVKIPMPGSDSPVDFWAVLPDDFKVRAADVRAFLAVGRLRPDRNMTEAQSALTVVADRRPRPTDRRYRPVVQSFEDIAFAPARRTVGVMAVGVGLVVVLAFANLAGLTVAEGGRRRLELSVRASLGASYSQLWRGIAMEHLWLAVCGVALGLPCAWLTLRWLAELVTAAAIVPPLADPPALHLGVTLGFVALTGVACVVWTALTLRGAQASHAEHGLGHGLSTDTARLTGDRHAGVLRLTALSIQAGLGLALMVLAVSMANGYRQMTNVDLGPAPDSTTFFRVAPRTRATLSPAQAGDFTSQVRALVRTLPDVEAVATVDSFPPAGTAVSFRKPGDEVGAPHQTTVPLSVSHDYFNTLGIEVLYGRSFDDADRYAGKPVAVIDREMARRHWRTLGEAVSAPIDFGARGIFEVIGVVESFSGYWTQTPVPTVYVSQEQQPSRTSVVILRTASVSNTSELLRQVFEGVPGGLEMSATATLQAEWQATATSPHARMVGMLLLALIGVGLAAQGMYALASSNAAARRQEMAIRSALGASRSGLIWLVLRPMVTAVLLGLTAGAFGVLAVPQLAPQWISAALVEPALPIAVGCAVLLVTAVLGGLAPARSATRPAVMAGLSR